MLNLIQILFTILESSLHSNRLGMILKANKTAFSRLRVTQKQPLFDILAVSRNGLQKAVFPLSDGRLLLWFCCQFLESLPPKNASEERARKKFNSFTQQSFWHHRRYALKLIKLKT
ncbi:hypothetical protein CEXT_634351 [Caerostris extrusa]|uniref:Uncharacterized protein n=1 Tax=Caerostris extrusa TaxID=172846 RepID=A0AAV4QPD7_CAEEX|nr:hypothetical protein CEXT_634351 [Caerostris extrusa]